MLAQVIDEGKLLQADHDDTVVNLTVQMPSGDTFPLSIDLRDTGLTLSDKIKDRTMLRYEIDYTAYFDRPDIPDQPIRDDWCIIEHGLQSGDIIRVKVHSPRVIKMWAQPDTSDEECVELVEENDDYDLALNLDAQAPVLDSDQRNTTAPNQKIRGRRRTQATN